MTQGPFREFAAPLAPKQLRARVLRACRLARALDPEPGQHWLDRVWESSVLRRSWGMTMLALLLLTVTVEPWLQQPRSQVRTKSIRDFGDLEAVEFGLFGSARPRVDRTLASAGLWISDVTAELEL